MPKKRATRKQVTARRKFAERYGYLDAPKRPHPNPSGYGYVNVRILQRSVRQRAAPKGVPVYAHRHPHSDPSHHFDTCSYGDRRGHRLHTHRGRRR